MISRKFTSMMLLAVISASAWSQSATLVGKLDESYSSEVLTSGRLLVGVWGGIPRGQIKPDELRILVPENPNTTSICFRASTRDGVYAASGVLIAPEKVHGAFQIEFYLRGTSIDQLLDYDSSDFAPAASIQVNCNDIDSAVYLPSMLELPTNTLTLALNSRGSVIIGLSIDGGVALPGSKHCATDTGRRSASFDTLCTVNVNIDASATSEHIVTLKRKPRAGPIREEDYVIIW